MRIRTAQRLDAYPGETEIGDAIFAVVHPDGHRALCAVVDGLGHGAAAAHAARTAVAVLSRHAEAETRDVVAVMRAIHEGLRGMRGAAATVVRIDDGELFCCGVGNVALRSHGAEVPFVLSPGILGGNVQRFRPVHARVASGQRLVLHSDGIASDLSLSALAGLTAEAACESIFRTHRKRHDDAAVLVIDVGA